MFQWNTTRWPIIALAPMAGVTDASYRQLIKSIAPETIVYTEFLSIDAIAYGAERTLQMIDFDPALERPFIVQVFGDDPDHFLKAARIIEQMGADGIDINMGCPAAKVVSSCHGAALIRNTDLAARLVNATVKTVKIPVSVKTRLGWNTAETLIPFCKRLVEAGAAMLAIHGRRFCDKFAGEAIWEPIYDLKRHVDVPVIGNGDIRTAEDAVEKIGNLDGVMVGRGTFGNPWLMRDIAVALRSSSLVPGSPVAGFDRQPATGNTISRSSSMPFEEKVPFILEHCRLAVRMKGEKRGMLEMRRHLASYVKGFPGASEVRMRLMQVERLDEARAILCG